MGARTKLLSLYDEWRALTEGEAEAIQNAQWDRVNEFQNAKRSLQPDIVRETDDARQELGTDTEGRTALDQQLRKIVNTLILLETRNGVLIAERKSACQTEIGELEGGQRNLSKIQRSYGVRPGALWQSYS